MVQPTSQPTPRWPGHYVEMPAGQLYVRTAPVIRGAEPALFIHGLGGSSTNWTDLMDLLSRPCDVRPADPVLACSAVDLPGFGCSAPAADGDYSLSSHAAAIIDLLDFQGQWPVHLIGNSMGGAVAVRVAARRPDLVRTLTLISPALPDLRPRALPLRLAVATAPGIGPRLMGWLQRLPAEIRADRAIRDLYNDPALVHPDRRGEQIAEVIRRDVLPYANDAMVRSARSLVIEYTRRGPTSLWRDAARTTAPALILHGSHDRLVNPAMAVKAARAFRSARVLVLPGVGHVAMMERPALVAAEIRAFLDWADALGPGSGRARQSAWAVAGDQRRS
jgi:pimeloyl-ACP methyl ester carboxylesterase